MTRFPVPAADQGHRASRRLAALAAATAVLLFAAPAAQAHVSILSFSAQPANTKAGGHPDFVVQFSLTAHNTILDPCDCNDAKDVTAHLPAGLIGNPHATPQCDISQFASDLCPPDSQVGIAEAVVSSQPGKGSGEGTRFLSPLFNLVPPPSEPALLGWKAALFNVPIFEVVSARTGSDYGLDVKTVSIPHFAPLTDFMQDTWGVPAAPIHDGLRFGLGQTPVFAPAIFGATESNLCDANANPSTLDPATMVQLCNPNQGAASKHTFVGAAGEWPFAGERSTPGPGFPVRSESPEEPFLQNPTTCGETSLATLLDVLSYDRSETHADSAWPATTDCAQLSFNPSQAIAPTTEAADSASGAEFRLTVPQFESPSVPSPSELRAASVTLPEGFALAPNVTNGKTVCTDAEARFGSTEEAHCPENAKLGTISVDTPVLPGPLNGAVYLGEPQPGNRYRMFLVFDGFGVHVKLAGTISPDPLTGQIQIDFQNLPQAPFETFNMHIFGSERGPLATPVRCGTYPVKSVFTPWDAALSAVTSTQFFDVNEGPGGSSCPRGPRPFAPGFQAASASSTAGAHTSFSIELTRADGDQNLAGLTVNTPPGFTATLRGVPYCPQAALDQLAGSLYTGLAELASPLCSASQVGTVTAGVGAGSHPLYLPGKVYIAGPYKGAPLSLLVVIPAVSGPYDLGNVAVRAALQVDPETAQVTTVSDPLPQIVGGIPIRTRQILVNLDRPDFALNPTNCDPFSVNAALTGDEGAQADLSNHFQVANCASLAYKPKLSLKLSGGLNRLGHPAIHSVLTTKPGEANTATVSVALPKGEILDNAHIESPCTRVELNAGQCPPGSVLGQAVAVTPLLDQPLEGPVYLTTGFGHRLPDLVADLRGQIHIQLDGKVDTVNGGSLRTTFETVPDAPVSSFTLDLAGGSRGLVQNSEGLCGAHNQAALRMIGQNGKVVHGNVPLQASCGKQGKRQRARAHHNREAAR